MSWDGYIKNMESEGCDYAVLCDPKGNKWAESKNQQIKISPDQVEHIAKGIDPNDNTDLRMEGVKLGDRKFLVVNQDDKTVTLKQIGGESTDKMMICAGRFKSGIIIGAAQAGEKEKCSRISVTKYTDYLKNF